MDIVPNIQRFLYQVVPLVKIGIMKTNTKLCVKI